VRAWGPLGWLLEKLPPEPEASRIALGTVSSEERCRAVPTYMGGNQVGTILLQIDDPSSRFARRIRANIATNLKAMKEDGALPLEVIRAPLFASDDTIADLLGSLLHHVAGSGAVSLVMDISCMPKRFFFLLVKLAIRDTRVSTLVVTYTQPSPGSYTTEHLAEDPTESQTLPGFGLVKEEPEQVIVSVGFEALGLPQLLSEFKDKSRDIVLLLPFPPGQPYSRRIWQSVLNIGHPGDANLKRIPALDPFAAFDIIENVVGEENRRERPPALAPYGPKPISLGMCLFALRYGSPVYYTQPRTYHPNYTFGVGSMWGYCLKLRGLAIWNELTTTSIAVT
jgi:hypothetical protein